MRPLLCHGIKVKYADIVCTIFMLCYIMTLWTWSPSPTFNDLLLIPMKYDNTVYLITDASYFENESYNVLQITGWIPLLDSNKENGGLEVCVHVYVYTPCSIIFTCSFLQLRKYKIIHSVVTDDQGRTQIRKSSFT